MVYFRFDRESMKLYIASRVGTAKSRNLITNQHISIVVHPANTGLTFQGLGTAQLIDEEEFAMRKITKILQKISRDSNYSNFPPPVLAGAESPLGIIEVDITEMKLIDATKLDTKESFDFSDTVTQIFP